MDFDLVTFFGGIATRYDAFRPEWPAQTARWLVGADPAGPNAAADRLRVLDLGAGTGKLTRTLAAAGYEVVAVDPSEGMLRVLRASLPEIETHVAEAERIPLPDGGFDAIAAVQAWHWFRHEDAAAECARLLRPGGTLGVGWHVRDVRVPWVAELERLTLPNGSRDDGWFGFPTPFEAAGTATFEHRSQLTVDGLVGLVGSWSYVEAREDRDEVLAEVAGIGRRVAGPDGVVVLPYLTRCFRAIRG